MNRSPSNEIFLKIGTRESTLAMHQTNHVRDKLMEIHPNLSCSIDSMETIGDKILDVALSKIGSKSLFTKELEEALAQKCVHIVVHSLKDMPTSLPEGMVIGAVLKREDPRDAVLLHPSYHDKCNLSQLPEGSLLGSSSVRRVAQLRRHFPQLQFESIRGNLNTRLKKLVSSDRYAGIILAAAGVRRMGWTDKISQYLEAEDCMYAVGQGAVAVECLAEDHQTLSLLQRLSDDNTLLATVAERALMAALAGGCSAPVAVWSKIDASSLTLKGGVWSLDGKEQLIEDLTTQLCPSDQENVVDSEGDSAKTSSSVDDSVDASSLVDGEEVSNGHGVSKRQTNAPCTEEPPTKVRRVEDAEADSRTSIVQPEVVCFSGIVPPPHLTVKASLAHMLGKNLAEVLLSKGAGKILSEAKKANEVPPPNVKPTNLPTGQ
ncbi:porphobilinogen deaminase-like [Hyalella azteca]|uniref:hydroxymethylbilane synthase n=1 Tax=Hyalella azteca TaxID=294128 RepID=A0A8B7PJ95_HYAAZ|nr:porphobilinogen deaminase-like [Hyalella azteca]